MSDKVTNQAHDELQAVLSNFLSKKSESARLIDKQYEVLWEEIKRLIFAGGKKMRPKLVLLAYEAYGGKDSKTVTPVALSLELLHLFLLIHDDIIDRDYTRYGTDNISGAYLRHYQNSINSQVDLKHYADSSAILAGDVLYSACYDLILASEVEPQKKLDIISIVNQTIFEVGGGELLDTESSLNLESHVDPLKIATYKTAGYSFICPLTIGATLASLDSEETNKLKSLGRNLGIAFQIKDDLLSVFGDESKTGKSNTSDIREKKHTFLIKYFYETVPETSQSKLGELFSKNKLDDYDIEQVKNLLEKAGVQARAEQEIQSLKSECLSVIGDMKISSTYQQKFYEIVEKCTNRDK